MRLRYYLRGLAVGILLTTIILVVANADNRLLTDAEIRQRALELGMIESESVKLSSLQPEESAPEESASERSDAVGSAESEIVSSTEESSGESFPEGSVPEESSAQESASVQPISFRIESGASSYTVSKKLAALGLVEDAAAFDTFLCNSGYSKKIRVGTYEIMPGTSEEDIAKMIAR